MKEQRKTNHDERRYSVSVAARNFLDEEKVGLVLFQPHMEDHLVLEILNSAGFKIDNPQFPDLISLAKQTFSIEDIGKLLKCFAEIEVTKVKVVQAFSTAEEDYEAKGEEDIEFYPTANFLASTLEGYSLAYEVMAIQIPYEGV